MAPWISIKQLVEAIHMPYEIIGDPERTVRKPASLDSACVDAVAFYAKQLEGAAERINASGAGVIIASKGIALHLLDTSTRTCILCRQPRLAFIRVMNRFFAPSRPMGIHTSSVIHAEATIGKNVYIGPFTCIGRAIIGDYTVIDGHVHIYDRVWIGKRCTIQAGAVIGSRGFGMERNENGEFEDFPHIGGVVIGDDVLVGTGVTIARGTMNDTVIGCGTKIDPLCQISHNVCIGNHCGVCALSTISGSARVNDYAWIAGGVSVREGLRIGNGASIGLGSVVVRDVRKGATAYGVPAKERAASRRDSQ